LNGACKFRSETRGEKVMEQKMVRISVEVRSGTARFRVGVQAENVRKALSMVEGGYPRGMVGVVFPTEPEGFFVSEPSAPAMVTGYDRIHGVAA
jgi:hypothetical protein